MEAAEDDTNKCKDTESSVYKEFILLKCSYDPRQSTDLIQSV